MIPEHESGLQKNRYCSARSSSLQETRKPQFDRVHGSVQGHHDVISFQGRGYTHALSADMEITVSCLEKFRNLHKFRRT